MNIKITKSKFSLNWYHDKIGETYEVAEVDKKDRSYAVFEGKHITSIVGFDDCKIIKDN